ncbi:MAG TPA: hypothetical protein PLT93_21000, partial [Phycisphaerae bacterium]|nr:hypothetical protein [Phycisphaerae bacterium]
MGSRKNGVASVAAVHGCATLENRSRTHARAAGAVLETPAYRVVILGAGRNIHGGLPTAVTRVGQQGCVLDWLLSAFSVLPDADVHFVGGYMAGAVMDRFRDIRFDFNPDWETTGPARSLAVAPIVSETATYVSYADVVFRPEIEPGP